MENFKVNNPDSEERLKFFTLKRNENLKIILNRVKEIQEERKVKKQNENFIQADSDNQN